jgi:hypothetical protein
VATREQLNRIHQSVDAALLAVEEAGTAVILGNDEAGRLAFVQLQAAVANIVGLLPGLEAARQVDLAFRSFGRARIGGDREGEQLARDAMAERLGELKFGPLRDLRPED